MTDQLPVRHIFNFFSSEQAARKRSEELNPQHEMGDWSTLNLSTSLAPATSPSLLQQQKEMHLVCLFENIRTSKFKIFSQMYSYMICTHFSVPSEATSSSVPHATASHPPPSSVLLVVVQIKAINLFAQPQGFGAHHLETQFQLKRITSNIFWREL